MKGQFMMLSAIVSGFILIATASSISEVRSQNLEPEFTRHDISMIKEQAQKISWTERGKFEDYLEKMDVYTVKKKFVRSQNCFNLTVVRGSQSVELDCIKLDTETSPKIAWVAVPNSNDRHWNVFNFFPDKSSFYRSDNGDLESEIDKIDFEMKQVEPPSYEVKDDEPAPIILVNNPNPEESWTMEWTKKNGNTVDLKMPAVRNAEADKLVFWEDLYTENSPNGDDWTDEIVRISYLTPETFRVAVYNSKGGYEHRLFIKVESENPLRGQLTFTKSGGETIRSTDSEGYLIEDRVYFVD